MITCVSIAKNEADNLPAFINSLKGLYDRLIIVDTGSTDGTVSIATEMGAEVRRIKWENFGQARQAATEIAGNEGWLVMFDCDMVLEGAKELRVALEEMPNDINVVRIMQEGPCGHKMEYELIWRAGTAKWKHRTHEQLHYTGLRTVVEAVKVIHPGPYGRYGNHNIPNLSADILDYPLDPGRNYYLGRELYYTDNIKGIKYLCTCARLSRWPEEAAMALVFAARLAGDQLDRDICLHLLEKAIKKAPHMREPFYTFAQWTLDPNAQKLAARTALENKTVRYFDCEPHMYEGKGLAWLNSLAFGRRK